MAIGDVWNFETGDEEWASEDLSRIVRAPMRFTGTRQRNYLKKLWDGEPWQSIKRRANTEGSVWYVWWMDGVRAHLRNLLEQKEEQDAH